MNVIKGLKLKMNNRITKVPRRSTLDSAGYDIFAPIDFVIPKESTYDLELPFHFENKGIEMDFQVRIFVRSSFGIKKKVRLYEKGERVDFIKINPFQKNTITVFNDTDEDLAVSRGEHFAQFIISDKEPSFEPTAIEDVIESERAKHIIPNSYILEVQENVFDYVLDEELSFEPFEQKLIPTGYKGKIDSGTWLGIYVHKTLGKNVFFGNGIAVIDQDYYNNSENNGNFFLSICNQNDKNVVLNKGQKVARLFSEKYFVLEDEIKPENTRTGGIGSTTEPTTK